MTPFRPHLLGIDDAPFEKGQHEPVPIVERAPRAVRIEDGLHLAHSGAKVADAARLVQVSIGKASLPEPLRIAHRVGAGWVKGESRGCS